MNEEIDSSTDTPDKEACTWGMLCHLLALCGFVIPFGNIIGPVIVWAIKKDTSEFIDDQGKESLNFQLTLTIACAVSAVLIFVAIGLLLLPVVAIYGLVMIIIASIKANEGERYRYPLNIRFFN